MLAVVQDGVGLDHLWRAVGLFDLAATRSRERQSNGKINRSSNVHSNGISSSCSSDNHNSSSNSHNSSSKNNSNTRGGGSTTVSTRLYAGGAGAERPRPEGRRLGEHSTIYSITHHYTPPPLPHFPGSHVTLLARMKTPSKNLDQKSRPIADNPKRNSRGLQVFILLFTVFDYVRSEI